jgi:hypothetical protein
MKLRTFSSGASYVLTPGIPLPINLSRHGKFFPFQPFPHKTPSSLDAILRSCSDFICLTTPGLRQEGAEMWRILDCFSELSSAHLPILTSSKYVGQHKYWKTRKRTAAHTDIPTKLLSYVTFNHFSKGAVNAISISLLVNHKRGPQAPSV